MKSLQQTDSMWLISLSSPLSEHQQSEVGGEKRPQQFRLITPPAPKVIIFWGACGSVSFVLNFLKKAITIVTFFYFVMECFFPPLPPRVKVRYSTTCTL